MEPATENLVPPARKRKARAPKPPVEKKTRKTAMTLERRVALMSPTHSEALRVLSKNDASFKLHLREELDRTEVAKAAVSKWESARDALAAADAAMKEPVAEAMKPTPHKASLDGLAHDIARRTGMLDIEPTEPAS